MIRAALTGALAPFRGVALYFSRPALWLVSVPIWIVGITWSLFSLLQFASESLDGAVLQYVGSIAAAGFAVAVGIVQCLIALLSPLLDYLAERTEHVAGEPERDSKLWQDLVTGRFFPRAGLAMLEATKLLAFKLGISAAAWLVGLIPAVGQAVAVTMVGLVLALDFLDYPLARRELKLGTKLDWLRQHWASAAAFSLACYGLLMTPGIGGLSLVPCVVGGSWLCCQLGMPEPETGQDLES